MAFVSKNVIAKFSSGVNSIVVLNESLEKLSEINSNIDALLDKNTPFGENLNNYKRLTGYLNQANIIHSDITKKLGKR